MGTGPEWIAFDFVQINVEEVLEAEATEDLVAFDWQLLLQGATLLLVRNYLF